jgi:hypothetical protein
LGKLLIVKEKWLGAESNCRFKEQKRADPVPEPIPAEMRKMRLKRMCSLSSNFSMVWSDFMAFLTKDVKGRSPYWIACFTTKDGRRLKKSTRCTDKGEAWDVLNTYARQPLLKAPR